MELQLTIAMSWYHGLWDCQYAKVFVMEMIKIKGSWSGNYRAGLLMLIGKVSEAGRTGQCLRACTFRCFTWLSQPISSVAVAAEALNVLLQFTGPSYHKGPRAGFCPIASSNLALVPQEQVSLSIEVCGHSPNQFRPAHLSITDVCTPGLVPKD